MRLTSSADVFTQNSIRAETKERPTFHSDTSISAVPRSQALIDTAVWIAGCLGAGELLFHSTHPCTKRVAPAAALGLRGLQVHALFFGRGPSLGVQATTGILAFLALPCWRLSHTSPLRQCQCRLLHKCRFEQGCPRREAACMWTQQSALV